MPTVQIVNLSFNHHAIDLCHQTQKQVKGRGELAEFLYKNRGNMQVQHGYNQAKDTFIINALIDYGSNNQFSQVSA